MKPSTARTLRFLHDAGPAGVTTGDFARAYIARFGARLEELRALGAVIETERLSASQFRYRLLAEPNVETAVVATHEPSGPASPPSPTLERAEEGTLALFDVQPRPVEAAVQDWDTAA